MNKPIFSFIGLISSILTIFNFLLAIPSVIENIEIGYLVKITENNFTLKVGFILILEFGIGYILTYLLAKSRLRRSSLNMHSAGLLIVLISSWLTLFNITELLYSGNDEKSTGQLFGMLFFILLSLLLQSFLIFIADWKWNRSNYGISNAEKKDEYEEKYKEELHQKFFWIIILAFFELVFFTIYWVT